MSTTLTASALAPLHSGAYRLRARPVTASEQRTLAAAIAASASDMERVGYQALADAGWGLTPGGIWHVAPDGTQIGQLIAALRIAVAVRS